MQLLFQRDPVSRTHPKCYRYQTLTIQDTCHTTYATANYTQKVRAFLVLVRCYRKFIKGLTKIAKPLTLLTRQQVKFVWTSVHHKASLRLKETIVQAPILHCPNPDKKYIVYTNASDDAYRAQLSQEHDGTEFPIAFLLHTFTETQRKWSTSEQEAYGIYYAITKWNYYLQGANITVKNDHKHLAQFLKWKKMLTIRSSDGVWNLPHTISLSNGFLELKTKQLIVSPGW